MTPEIRIFDTEQLAESAYLAHTSRLAWNMARDWQSPMFDYLHDGRVDVNWLVDSQRYERVEPGKGSTFSATAQQFYGLTREINNLWYDMVPERNKWLTEMMHEHPGLSVSLGIDEVKRERGLGSVTETFRFWLCWDQYLTLSSGGSLRLVKSENDFSAVIKNRRVEPLLEVELAYASQSWARILNVTSQRETMNHLSEAQIMKLEPNRILYDLLPEGYMKPLRSDMRARINVSEWGRRKDDSTYSNEALVAKIAISPASFSRTS